MIEELGYFDRSADKVSNCASGLLVFVERRIDSIRTGAGLPERDFCDSVAELVVGGGYSLEKSDSSLTLGEIVIIRVRLAGGHDQSRMS